MIPAGRGVVVTSMVATAMVLASLGTAARAVADEATRLGVGDFAQGRVLEPGSSRALQSATLDLEVYRASVEPGLADLRVFNAAGETVPHAIRAAPPAAAREAGRVRLPLFPLADLETASGTGGTLEIDAEISESGAILRLRDGRAGRSAPADRGVWLVDASGLDDGPIVGLELEPGPSSEDFIAHLRVDASDDLTSFRTHVRRAVLARLSRGGHEIERLDLALPATRARYLKLTLIEGVLPGSLSSVTARTETPAEVPRLLRTRVSGTAVEGESGQLLYDVRADLPIEWIDVVPGEPNTLLEVRIESARDPDGPWTPRYAGLVYRLEPGGSLRNAPIPWRGGAARHLRLTISPRGGADASRVQPEIEVGWRPAQLVFVARGEAPFTLAYGRRGARDVSFAASRLVGVADTELSRLDESTATLGAPMMLAGDRAYALPPSPPAPFPWRQVALWTVLVVAVGIVLRMSLRLLGRSEDAGDGDAAGVGTAGEDTGGDERML